MHRARKVVLAILTIPGLALSGCGTAGGPPQGAPPGFPLTIENCGQTVVVPKPPERVVLLQSVPLPLLDAVGALDRVASIATKGDTSSYPENLQAKVDAIPNIGTGPSDRQEVSVEELIAQRPDILLGSIEGVGLTREALTGTGIPVIEPPNNCVDTAFVKRSPTFEDIYSDVELYGRIFDRSARATAAIADLRNRVTAAEKSAQGLPERTAAALYVEGGTSNRAYGAYSIVTEQMRYLGLTNVFGDVQDRIFDLGLESLIQKNPDVIIAVYTEPDRTDTAIASIRSLPGTAGIPAVRENRIITAPYDLAGGVSPLAVLGLERFAAALAQKK